jgi:hypothetical protein
MRERAPEVEIVIEEGDITEDPFGVPNQIASELQSATLCESFDRTVWH